MRFIIMLLSLTFLAFTQGHADESVPARPVKFGIQSFKDLSSDYLALNFENFPHWHTYWKNPGDAGLAVKNVFTVDAKEIKMDEVEWPMPRRFIEQGNLWAYGYEGAYTFFFKISKADFNKYNGKTIEVKSTWLVCKHICIPGQQITQFKITPGQVSTQTEGLMNPIDSTVLTERFNAIPKSAPLPKYLTLNLVKGKTPNTLVLVYGVAKTTELNLLKDSNLLYAFPQVPFDVKHEALSTGTDNLSAMTEISWDGEYLDPPQEFPKNGKFKRPYTLKFLFNDPIEKKPIVIEKKFTSFELNEVQIAPAENNPPSIGGMDSNDTKADFNPSASSKVVSIPIEKNVIDAKTNSFIYYLALAFIGGLILNIMPCVLPVISIKLFGLVKYQNESHKTILRHNFFYTLGILSTFLVLATIVLSLKSIGSQVGWGFQLQSPTFISVMIMGLFIFALNLFGVFEFRTPGGSKLGNVTTNEGLTGDFLSGVLATVLSTPCSAPFLGTALTFAFTSSTVEIYAIFTMIGLGLAFPFILTAIYPKLVAFLPRPGNWMNTVKKILGVTLILTTVWLLDVYNALVDGSSHLIKLGVILVFIYAGFLLLRKKEKWIGFASFLIALGIFVNISSTDLIASTDEQTALIRDKQSTGLDWQAWSEAKMNEHKTNQQVVFIDFTAKWCFTCKVNEKIVLETNDFKTLVQENNLKLLIGDWTKRDEIIGTFLRKNGLVGVPAYFIQKKDGTLVNLGETVSIARIKENLN
jgi:thiol:disulfide interchange protein/DsbC/DsbD-like thiol-disulfide interchange protein